MCGQKHTKPRGNFQRAASVLNSIPIPRAPAYLCGVLRKCTRHLRGVHGRVYIPSAALVLGPKYPAAGVMPFAFWNLIKAARVAEPKRVVSFPEEPAPDAAIG